MSTLRAARLLLVALSTALTLSCGGDGGNNPTEPEVSVTVTPPTATITASTSQTFTATVTGTSNTTVQWSIIESGGGSVTSAGVYTAPADAGTYHVVATSVADSEEADTATVTVVPAPTITSFTAEKSVITSGSSTTIAATFTGGTASINNGVGAVTSGTAISVGPLTTSTTYTLTVTNSVGASVTQDLTIDVVAAPSITSFTADPASVASGSASTLTGVFANGTAVRRPDNVVMTSGVGSSTGALSSTTTYTLVVTNAAGDSATATTTVTVVTSAPTITSFTATPATISVGDATTLAWDVAGASTMSIDQGVGTVTGTSQQVSPATTTTYTLTATNVVGSTTAAATVTVYFPPAIANFTAAQSTIQPGGSTTITPTFSQGTGVIDHGIGAVTSGVPISTGPLTSSRTYTLTVTNPAGTVATRTLTVSVDPGYFASTGSMTVARHFHASVTLTDGSVLVVGGYSGSGLVTTAETYDPSTGTWTPTTGAPVVARGHPVATMLADGRVLITGGLNGSGTHQNTAEIYDPATRSFTPTAGNMNQARVQHTSTLLANGEVLIAGGNTGAGTTLGSAEIFNPATGTFSTTGSLGTARWDHEAILLPTGKVIMVGGNGTTSSSVPLEQFDPATDYFEPLSGTTSAGVNATLLLNGRIFIAGQYDRRAWVWDNGTLTQIGDQLRFRTTSSQTLLSDGTVLVVGDSGLPGMEGRSEAEVFNPATSTFKFTGATLTSRGQATLHLLTSGKVLVVGGFQYGTGVHQTTELYSSPTLPTAPLPPATVSAPAGATAGQTGITASVPATTGARYIWHVTGGTITAGLRTNSITITAGPAGQMKISALVISSLGMPSTGSATVTVSP